MTDRIFKKGLGYLRGFRSPKDYRPNTKEVQRYWTKTKIKINLKEVSASLPTKNDSRKRFTPVRDQGDLGSWDCFCSCWSFRIHAIKCK